MSRRGEHLRSVVAITFVCAGVVATMEGRQNQPDERVFALTHVERKAAEAKANRGDQNATRGLVDEIFERSFVHNAPRSIRERIVRAEDAFHAGRHRAVTEKDLVNAINQVAADADAPAYARTSGAQLHLFREFLWRLAPSVKSPGTAPTEMSPAEATFVTIHLAYQKFSNAEYQVDPDAWAQGVSERKAGVRPLLAADPVTSRVHERPASHKVVFDMLDDLQTEDSATARGVHAFFDKLGLQR